MMEFTESIIALSLTLFFILVGLPVWWETTKVYRATLPYNEISSLASRINYNLTFKLQWNVLIDETLLQSDSIPFPSFTDTFSQLAEKGLRFSNLQVSYASFQPDLSKINETEADDTNLQSLFDYIIRNVDSRAKDSITQKSCYFYHNIVFVPMPIQLSKMLRRDQMLLVGGSYTVVLRKDFVAEELKNDLQWIVSRLHDTLLPICEVKKSTSMEECSASDKTLQSSSGLDISFVLANSNPLEYIVDWNIETAIATKLLPLLKVISDFGPFRISSRILNFIEVGIQPQKVTNRGYFYSSKALPLLINSIETHLNEYTSKDPLLHFIQYIPPISYMPLMFMNNTVTFRSFTIPRWGSININNLSGKHVIKNYSVSKQELGIANIEIEADVVQMLSQFRELIGLKRKTFDGIFYASVDRSAVAKWEVDYLFLKRTIQNLRKSISIMVSLAALLEEIANIVIKNEIRSLLEHAISNIKDSKLFLAKGELRKGFLASKSALSMSSKAFYDHSLLSLLYFPDDQKYAIYLPLFFPIFVPLFISFVLATRTLFVDRNTR